VKTFDSNYIYDRSTELNWNDPTSFKRFNRDLLMSQRCLRTDQVGVTLKIPCFVHAVSVITRSARRPLRSLSATS